MSEGVKWRDLGTWNHERIPSQGARRRLELEATKAREQMTCLGRRSGSA
jgi:hypothetical protein